MGYHCSSVLDVFSVRFLKLAKGLERAQKFSDSFPGLSPDFTGEKPGKLSKRKRGVNSQLTVHTSSGGFSDTLGPHS